jgi:hypothetical protein
MDRCVLADDITAANQQAADMRTGFQVLWAASEHDGLMNLIVAPQRGPFFDNHVAG